MCYVQTNTSCPFQYHYQLDTNRIYKLTILQAVSSSVIPVMLQISHCQILHAHNIISCPFLSHSLDMSFSHKPTSCSLTIFLYEIRKLAAHSVTSCTFLGHSPDMSFNSITNQPLATQIMLIILQAVPFLAIPLTQVPVLPQTSLLKPYDLPI